MPTGYTAGIIDGTTKTFEDFAKICMRAFGAAIHMRDDPFDAVYVPDKVSEYHSEQIAKIQESILEFTSLSKEEVLKREIVDLEKEKRRALKEIEKDKKTEETLNSFLAQALAYQYPTEEHKGIKDFMVSQIKETISFDCNREWHHKTLISASQKLKSLNYEDIYKEKMANWEKELEYHEKHYKEDIERVNKRNKWVEDFLESLPKKIA